VAAPAYTTTTYVANTIHTTTPSMAGTARTIVIYVAGTAHTIATTSTIGTNPTGIAYLIICISDKESIECDEGYLYRHC
jgi:hypothetical protein